MKQAGWGILWARRGADSWRGRRGCHRAGWGRIWARRGTDSWRGRRGCHRARWSRNWAGWGADSWRGRWKKDRAWRRACCRQGWRRRHSRRHFRDKRCSWNLCSRLQSATKHLLWAAEGTSDCKLHCCRCSDCTRGGGGGGGGGTCSCISASLRRHVDMNGTRMQVIVHSHSCRTDLLLAGPAHTVAY